MIKSWEALGEELSEIELRLSFLENSDKTAFLDQLEQRITDLEKRAIPVEEWTPKQWDAVKQLKAQVLHLSNKVEEMRVAKRKPNRYTKYS